MGELTTYRGYTIYVTDRYFVAEAPNGDTHRYPSMTRTRKWILDHEKGWFGGRRDPTRILSPVRVEAAPPTTLEKL